MCYLKALKQSVNLHIEYIRASFASFGLYVRHKRKFVYLCKRRVGQKFVRIASLYYFVSICALDFCAVLEGFELCALMP